MKVSLLILLLLIGAVIVGGLDALLGIENEAFIPTLVSHMAHTLFGALIATAIWWNSDEEYERLHRHANSLQ